MIDEKVIEKVFNIFNPLVWNITAIQLNAFFFEIISYLHQTAGLKAESTESEYPFLYSILRAFLSFIPKKPAGSSLYKCIKHKSRVLQPAVCVYVRVGVEYMYIHLYVSWIAASAYIIHRLLIKYE